MEDELSRAVDMLPGMVWTARADGQLDYVNRCWSEYSGLTLADIAERGWQALVHPADVCKLLDDWQAIRASGKPNTMHARLRRSDGEYGRFVLRVRPLNDDAEGLARWCGVNTDVDACLAAARHDAEDKTSVGDFIEGIPALVALMTPEGAVERVNHRNLEYLGATLEQLKGWAATDTVHPDDLADVVARWMHSVQTGEPYDIEHRIRRADGAYHWFHVRGLPLRDHNDCITRWCVLETDIDDKRRNREILAGENRLLEMVVNGESTQDVLEAVCDIVEDVIGDCYASVLLLDSSGTRLERGAAPRLPADFIDNLTSHPITADSGPAPMAMALNREVVSADLAEETRWVANNWPAMAMKHGVRACCATPITTSTGEVVGVLAVYFDRPRSLTTQNTTLIRRLRHSASINIERQRSQRSLAQAHEDVHLSEDRLRAIIDTVPGFVWQADPDGNVEFLNQRWCDYTGISLKESLGIGWTSRIHPDDAPGLVLYWQALLKAGEPGMLEARLRRADGAYRWFLIRAVPLLDSNGRVLSWYGQNTDIEDRKRAEMLLADEKHLLGLMAGGTPLAQVLTSLCALARTTLDAAQCAVTLVNHRRTRLSQYAPQGLRLQSVAVPPGLVLGETEIELVHAATTPVAMCAARNAPVTSVDLARETRWDDWCKRALSLGLQASWSVPITTVSGDVVGVFSVLFGEPKTPESTHRQLMAPFTQLAKIAIEHALSEARLKQSEAFLAKAQRLSSTGTLAWRVSTDEIIWSEEVYRIYGFDPALPVTFERIYDRIHPEDVPSHREMSRRRRLQGRDFEHDHRLLMPDGSVKYLHFVAQATSAEDGELEYIAAVQDVTQRRHSEEALARVRSELAHVARVASLGALTASIAHEVNQPLSGIITNASTCLRMLAADPPNVDGARETARRTIRDGNRASDVIKRLRAMFAKKSITNEGVDLNEAAREVIAMLLGELQRASVNLHAELADDLPLICGDRVQLQQVILNLIMNGSDAMSETSGRPRHMRVSTSVDARGHVCLAVTDCGSGFDPGDAERLFHAFYTTKSSGMGIGLSVSRSIIEGHDGRLWATPNADHGATFTFSLPPTATADHNKGGPGASRETSVDPDATVESF